MSSSGRVALVALLLLAACVNAKSHCKDPSNMQREAKAMKKLYDSSDEYTMLEQCTWEAFKLVKTMIDHTGCMDSEELRDIAPGVTDNHDILTYIKSLLATCAIGTEEAAKKYRSCVLNDSVNFFSGYNIMIKVALIGQQLANEDDKCGVIRDVKRDVSRNYNTLCEPSQFYCEYVLADMKFRQRKAYHECKGKIGTCEL